MLQVGDSAPDFSLINTQKEVVTLSASAGKPVVLLFFPAAFTGVCTTELCNTRDDIAFYNNVNATVYGISVDLPFTLEKFKGEQNLNFELLSDFNKDASRAYSAIYEDWILGLKGVAKRSAFVVDAAGKIAYAEVLENPGDMPNFAAVKAALEAL
jgi:glutaredoxin-dependent peroxiredoxin